MSGPLLVKDQLTQHSFGHQSADSMGLTIPSNGPIKSCYDPILSVFLPLQNGNQCDLAHLDRVPEDFHLKQVSMNSNDSTLWARPNNFSSKICHHFRELYNSGAVVTDRDIMATLLYKLPAEFDHLIPKLNQCRTVKEFVGLVKDTECKMIWKRALEEKKHREFKRFNLFDFGLKHRGRKGFTTI